MQVSERRLRFMQDLDRQLKGREGQAESGASGKHSEVKNIKSIIVSKPSQNDAIEEVFACLNRLEERIDTLEMQMKRHFGNSKLVETEINKLVANRWESLSRETDECLTRMTGEMQDLRDIVIGLRSSVRGMEK